MDSVAASGRCAGSLRHRSSSSTSAPGQVRCRARFRRASGRAGSPARTRPRPRGWRSRPRRGPGGASASASAARRRRDRPPVAAEDGAAEADGGGGGTTTRAASKSTIFAPSAVSSTPVGASTRRAMLWAWARVSTSATRGRDADGLQPRQRAASEPAVQRLTGQQLHHAVRRATSRRRAARCRPRTPGALRRRPAGTSSRPGRRSRSWARRLSARDGSSSLTATCRLLSVSSAWYTTATLPWPMGSRSTYRLRNSVPLRNLATVVDYFVPGPGIQPWYRRAAETLVTVL